MFLKFSYHFLHIFPIALILFTVNACLTAENVYHFFDIFTAPMVFYKYLFITWWLFHSKSEAQGPDRLVRQFFFYSWVKVLLPTIPFRQLSINFIYFFSWLILLAGSATKCILLPSNFLTCSVVAQFLNQLWHMYPQMKTFVNLYL